MTAIERAEALLAAATVEEPPKCECPGLIGYGRPTHNNPCAWFDTVHSRGMARLKIGELGFFPDTLRGYIGAVNALVALRGIMDESAGVVGWHLNGATAEWGEFEFEEGMEQSVADFERLFPEEPPAPRIDFDRRG